MKLAFSTLGMPGQGLREAVATAVEYGCAGLELRLHPDTGVHAGLSPARRAAVREILAGSPEGHPAATGAPGGHRERAGSSGGRAEGAGSSGGRPEGIGLSGGGRPEGVALSGGRPEGAGASGDGEEGLPGGGGEGVPGDGGEGAPGAARRAGDGLSGTARPEVSALAGYVRIAAAGPDEPVVRALRDDLALAADLGAPAVRVFPGGDDVEAGARRLRAVADLCAESGVRVLVETHDAMPTGAAVGRLLDAAGVPEAVGALWDVLHPWRHGEEPAETLAALAGHLAYVQIKDAVSAGDTTPVPMWAGGVPLDECGELLRGFGGWVSLEWERTWYPHVAPVEEILPGAREWVARFSS
ncbi:sugar phosphate isomerase/epimerase family protein [Streptosporangium sp. V21-05]|uniref:sugar phosphate isomerase/epimerase family protein n=1 Tax=Streptosporangium sp. V21-05 TaxID=3446115 RepID=UPI003F534714